MQIQIEASKTLYTDEEIDLLLELSSNPAYVSIANKALPLMQQTQLELTEYMAELSTGIF